MIRRAAVFLFGIGAVPVAAQVADTTQSCTAEARGAGLPGVAGVRADYVRSVSLRGGQPTDVSIRRPSHGRERVAVPCEEPWRIASTDTIGATATAATGVVDAVFNSGYPHGTRTGLLWPGRGVQVLWTAGAEYRYGVLHIGLYPQLALHQNRDFPIVPFPGDSGSTYAYAWARSAGGHPRIDWPQRHGDEAFSSATLGQSFVSVELAGVRAGLSSENLWWGPAVRNSILLGNEAAGFPHAFVGLPQGINTPVGRFGAELVWGRLSESDYFNDITSDDDHRFFTGIIATFEPRGATGLSVGGARLYYQPYEDVGVTDLLPFLESPFKYDLITPDNPRGENIADQMVGVFARYALPRTGFEVYGEWTRNDHSQHVRDFYAEPDHSRAYTLGFQQVIADGTRWYRLRGELTQLAKTRTIQHRPTPTYYVHHLVRQGYTHGGQLLGAGIGPGSEAQYVAVDMFLSRGSHGLYLERVRYDEDAFYTFVSPRYGFQGHDVELTGGTMHFLRFGPIDVSVGISYSSRRNRGFRHCNPTTPVPRDCRQPAYRDRNLHVPIGIVWRSN